MPQDLTQSYPSTKVIQNNSKIESSLSLIAPSVNPPSDTHLNFLDNRFRKFQDQSKNYFDKLIPPPQEALIEKLCEF